MEPKRIARPPTFSPLSAKAAAGARRPEGVGGGPGASGAGAGAGASNSPLGAATARQAPLSLAEVIDHLSSDIQRLRIDFERFFSGALLLPPEDLRQRLQAQLRNLRNANGGSAVDRFRLGDLEARFNSYNELFNRRMRDREEGRHRTAGAAALAAAAAVPEPRYDPAKGIVIGRLAPAGAVTALYEGLAAGGGAAGAVGSGGPRFDLATFGSYLERQVAALREKTGCEEVQFRLVAEDGKVKLKARPLGGNRAWK